MPKQNCVTVGHWDRPRAELDALARPLGGRTFHRAYEEQWASFMVSATVFIGRPELMRAWRHGDWGS
jgi:hypothetical protein